MTDSYVMEIAEIKAKGRSKVSKSKMEGNEFNFWIALTWKELVLTTELICLSNFKPETTEIFCKVF